MTTITKHLPILLNYVTVLWTAEFKFEYRIAIPIQYCHNLNWSGTIILLVNEAEIGVQNCSVIQFQFNYLDGLRWHLAEIKLSDSNRQIIHLSLFVWLRLWTIISCQIIPLSQSMDGWLSRFWIAVAFGKD